MKLKIQVSIFYLSLIIIWQMVFEQKFFPSYIFPSPWMVGERLWELWQDDLFIPSLRATLIRMGVGFSISVFLGILVGLGMGLFPFLRQSLKSLLLGLQTLPSVAWVPISLLIFGLKDSGIYFVIIMSSLAAIAIATAEGIATIPRIYLRAAKTLGVSTWDMSWRVIFPGALPSIVTGIKLGWTMGWHGVVSAELIKSSLGLGFLLHMGRELNDMAQVVGMMIITILISLFLDRFLFGVIEQRIRARWGLV